MNVNLSTQKKRVNIYLRFALRTDASVSHAVALQESSRSAPWRIDVEMTGKAHSFVLRFDERGCEHEFNLLKAIENISFPSPNVYGLDNEGKHFGTPCFLMDYMEGESMLQPLLAGEGWAEDLYLESVMTLQRITREQLGPSADNLEQGESALDILEIAYTYLKTIHDPMAERGFQRLRETAPNLSPLTFSNGDLYPDNLRHLDRAFSGVIDFQHAGFSDGLFEFLLAFFVHPELRGRGLEERYCERMGIDAGVLDWYHALEFYDTWHYLHKNNDTFAGYDAAGCRAKVEVWVAGEKL